ALGVAGESGRALAIGQAATFSAWILLLEEDWSAAGKLATRALDLSDEYGFPRWRGSALVMHGRAIVGEGDGDRGLAEMREGLELLRPAALRLGNSAQLALLPEGCVHLNRFDEGMAAIGTGLTYSPQSSGSMFGPGLW